MAFPLVRLSLSADQPEASVDRLGLGNIYVEPLKLGTRWSHVDAVAGYSFYIPTAQGSRSGLGRPQWSHQFSLGGTGFVDDRRGWRVSALASYVINGKKRGVDVTRGDTIQIEGGAGGRVLDNLDAGIIGYALWQVTDDRGSALPAPLAGVRERVFGLGPEISMSWCRPCGRGSPRGSHGSRRRGAAGRDAAARRDRRGRCTLTHRTTSTAAPSKRPARRSSSARSRRRAHTRATCGRSRASAASASNSWPSWRVRFATDLMLRSSHSSAIRKRRDVAHVDAAADDDAAGATARERRGHERADRREDDRGVERPGGGSSEPPAQVAPRLRANACARRHPARERIHLAALRRRATCAMMCAAAPNP